MVTPKVTALCKRKKIKFECDKLYFPEQESKVPGDSVDVDGPIPREGLGSCRVEIQTKHKDLGLSLPL